MIHKYNNSTELCKQVARESDGTCLLAFSTGKDAVSAWIELRKHFKRIIPVYYYVVPDMQFVESSLKYYEEFFNTQIIRLPNPNLYRKLNNQVYQTPANIKILKRFGFPPVTREHLLTAVREDLKLSPNVYIAIGNRAADNLQRQRSIVKRKSDGTIAEYRAHNDKNKTFYPTFDWKIADVVKSIKDAGVKLPVDYVLWGKTFDGFDYRFIRPLKDHYPDDYQKIKNLFPLIDLEIMRYEQI